MRGAKSVDEVTAKLKEFAKDKKGWIIGRGWNQELWSNTRFPTAADLDKACATLNIATRK